MSQTLLTASTRVFFRFLVVVFGAELFDEEERRHVLGIIIGCFQLS